jgi:peptidoglycan/xylan/chitin deacetylase (PgdA/CDA1 family)
LLGPASLPARLQLPVAGSATTWELGGAATGSFATPSTDRAPKPWEAEPTSRLGFFYGVWKCLRGLNEEQRELALRQIEVWSGADGRARPTHRILAAHEVCELAKRPGMSIGAHSVSHATLSTCPVSVQKSEIQQCKVELQKILSKQVSTFAYPFGDFGPETPDLVMAAGFDGACIADPGFVWSETDPYQLPRVAILDWGTEEFGRALTAALQ